MTPEIAPLLFTGLRDIVEMQHGMAATVEPGAQEIERRAWPVRKSEHLLIEKHGLI